VYEALGGTTTATGDNGSDCTATYRVTGQWSSGFQGDVAIRNNSSTALSGWTVKWTLGPGQRANHVWNGTLTASGQDVSVRNASYNGSGGPRRQHLVRLPRLVDRRQPGSGHGHLHDGLTPRR
jgi:hypothetical protein